MSAKKYKKRIDQIVSNLSNNTGLDLSMNKGILGLVVNDKIITFSKVLRNKDKVNEFLNYSMKRINWSVRNINIFNKCGINIIKDFSKFSEEEMLGFKNFGKKCLREIYDKLEDVGLDIEKTPKSLDLESLVKYVLSGLSARHRDIICRRYGLWEGERETLEEISRSFGVTRERIRQIQASQVKKIQRVFKNSIQVILSLEELFIKSLRPFLEANYNIANSPELLKIIYDIDDEKIGVDIANEFLSEVFFDGKPIFNDFTINFDKDVVGLRKKDHEFYLKLIKVTNSYLREKKSPQNIDELFRYFVKNRLVKDVARERERIIRYLTVSNVERDATGKFGLKRWRYFNSNNTHAWPKGH